MPDFHNLSQKTLAVIETKQFRSIVCQFLVNDMKEGGDGVKKYHLTGDTI